MKKIVLFIMSVFMVMSIMSCQNGSTPIPGYINIVDPSDLTMDVSLGGGTYYIYFDSNMTDITNAFYIEMVEGPIGIINGLSDVGDRTPSVWYPTDSISFSTLIDSGIVKVKIVYANDSFSAAIVESAEITITVTD